MASLEQILEGFGPANTSQHWYKAEPISLISGERPTHPLAVAALQEWADSAKTSGKTLYLIPINSWYRQKDGEHPKRRSHPGAYRFASAAHLPVYDGIVKVNHSDHGHAAFLGTPLQPGFFAGHFPPNAMAVLYDNAIESGATMRDMMRFAECSGVPVVGMVEGDGFHGFQKAPFDALFPHAKTTPSGMPDTSTVINPAELISFVQQSKKHPERFTRGREELHRLL